MKFKDIQTALAMRDWAERVATGVVNRMRPAPTQGEVTSVDMATRTATIRTAGQTADEPDIRVNYMPHLAPNQVRSGPFRGNIVEVSGNPGDLYITKIYSGLYCDEYGAPSGMRADFSGLLVPPPGWLLENGQAVSRTQYFRLFARIGTTYGAGDGSTTFNVDNTMGRMSVGYDPLQTEFDSLTDKGGFKTHTLVEGQLPYLSGFFYFHGSGSATVGTQSVGGIVGTGVARGAYRSGGANTGGANSVDAYTFAFGGNQAHPILNPYYVSLKCVKI